MRVAWLIVVLSGCPRGGSEPPAPTPGSVVWPDPPAADGTIGADASLFVEAMAADGSWVRLCQAQDTDADRDRETAYAGQGYTVGDHMLPTLVLGSGAGDVIEAALAVSHDERWLAVWRTGGLHLIDARARTVTEVTEVLATARDVPPIAAGFSADSAWLAWSLNDRLVARELATGAERDLDLGAAGGRIWAIETIGVAGPWVRVDVVRRDTDGDGQVEARWGINESHPGPCDRPFHGGAFGRVGDEPDPVWIDLATGEQRDTMPTGALPPQYPRAYVVPAIGSDRIAARDASGRALVVATGPSERTPARGPLHWADPARGDIGAVCGCGQARTAECTAVECQPGLRCGYPCGIPGCDSICMTPEQLEDKIP